MSREIAFADKRRGREEGKSRRDDDEVDVRVVWRTNWKDAMCILRTCKVVSARNRRMDNNAEQSKRERKK
jgi:hypothetical protein